MAKVVVVGAGIAGLTAAITAAQSGAEVTVLERAPLAERGGNTRFSNSAIRAVSATREHVLSLLPELSDADAARCEFATTSREAYLADLYRITGGRCDPMLAELLVEGSYEALAWLVDVGVGFVPLWDWARDLGNGRVRVFLEAKGSGEGLSNALFAAAAEHGVEVVYETRAVALIESAAGIVGVRARGASGRTEYLGDAVVLAAGGFQANPEWRARYLGPGWDLVKVRGSRYDTGDGLQMALAAGAEAYGHWSGAHSTNWDLNAPALNALEDNTIFKRDDFNYGLMINARGERFVDEGEDLGGFIYAKMGPAILAQPGGFAWQVYDKKVDPFIHPEYRSPHARRVVADCLEDLVAGMSGVDPAGFLSTIASFNAAVDDERPFTPGQKDGRATRGLTIDKSNWAQAIDTPPFQAYGVTSGITFTFGGVRVDAEGRVLDGSAAPIPGLFAAGEMVGGLFYSNYPGGASLAAAAVFGRLAGRAAATA